MSWSFSYFQTYAEVAKASMTDIFPRWGVLRKISSDTGTLFASDAIKTTWTFPRYWPDCSYHPASGGTVERENGILKAKLGSTNLYLVTAQ